MNDNPFKRLREGLALTMHAVAIRVPCSKHLIIRAEQGTFTDPPPILLEFYLDYPYPISVAEPTRNALLYDYRTFQRDQRQSHRRFLGQLPDLSPSQHPLTRWRTHSPNNYSLTEIAKNLCVNQGTLHRFETKPELQLTVPGALLLALSEAGYSPGELRTFKEDYQDYRASLNEWERLNGRVI